MVRLITYYPTGQEYIVEERVDGKRQDDVFIYNAAGCLINRLLYFDNGQNKIITYMHNNIRHNEHGPAKTEWYHNGKCCYIGYWQNGIRHNLPGTIFISWFDNGEIFMSSCWQNGNTVKHNIV